jgi:molybdate/tungstate transport system substrate-binding protein
LLAWQLAARHYGIPDLESRMLRAAPARNVRPREADQIALLQAGELDYIWTYENLAALSTLRFVKLPDDVDLGSAEDSAAYALAVTRVPGRRAGDTLLVHGKPIGFGVAVRAGSARSSTAERFVAYLLSPEGRRILRAAHFDALDAPLFSGTEIPGIVSDSAAVRSTPPSSLSPRPI